MNNKGHDNAHKIAKWRQFLYASLSILHSIRRKENIKAA